MESPGPTSSESALRQRVVQLERLVEQLMARISELEQELARRRGRSRGGARASSGSGSSGSSRHGASGRSAGGQAGHEGHGHSWASVEQVDQVIPVKPDSCHRDGVEAMLGPDSRAIVGSDRYSAYSHLPPRRRQVCWAHLRRTFEEFGARGGEAAWVGQRLLDAREQLFARWYRGPGPGPCLRSEREVRSGPLFARAASNKKPGPECCQGTPRFAQLGDT